MSLQLRDWVEKAGKIHRLSGKEKVPDEAVSKEAHAESSVTWKGPIAIDILKKGMTENNDFFYQLLR